MKVSTSQQLYAYWNDLRGGRLAPRRFEIEPASIAAILPDTFILEREDRNEYMFRLAGTRICDRFGREFRGRNLLDLWTPDDREVIIRVLESVTRDGGVGVVGLMAGSSAGKQAAFEMLLLPLVHTGQSISRVLGALSPIAAQVPLIQEPYNQIELSTFDVIWPDGRPHALVARAGAPAPFIRDTGDSKVVRFERRSFRVYEGGRKDTVIGDSKPGPK